jgi:hypothetical protein
MIQFVDRHKEWLDTGFGTLSDLSIVCTEKDFRKVSVTLVPGVSFGNVGACAFILCGDAISRFV